MNDIHPQYTFDNSGNPVGVFLPIEDWNTIADELNMDLPEWQKEMIDSRLAAYAASPESTTDWADILAQFNAEDEEA